MQPLLIQLAGKKVVIAGGGKTAARKAAALSAENPRIIFIAPEFCAEARKLAEKCGYQLVQRKAAPEDFQDAMLVVLAANDPRANEELARSVPPDRLLCNAEQAENGNVFFPAVIRRGKLKIAVSTTGASPKLTRKLKKVLAEYFDETWKDYTEFLSECRSIIKSLPVPFETKDKMLFRLLDDAYRLDSGKREAELARLKELEKKAAKNRAGGSGN